MNPSHVPANLAIVYSPRMMRLSDQQRPGRTEPAIPRRLEMPGTVSVLDILKPPSVAMSTMADQSFRPRMFQPAAEHDSGKLDLQIFLPGMLCVLFGNGKQSVINAARGVCVERRSFDLSVTSLQRAGVSGYGICIWSMTLVVFVHPFVHIWCHRNASNVSSNVDPLKEDPRELSLLEALWYQTGETVWIRAVHQSSGSFPAMKSYNRGSTSYRRDLELERRTGMMESRKTALGGGRPRGENLRGRQRLLSHPSHQATSSQLVACWAISISRKHSIRILPCEAHAFGQ
jgi:hypothetical protein